MRISAQAVSASLLGQMADVEEEIARDVTEIMREETDALKAEYRGQVIEAGMGQRLANTWQGQTYPRGTASLNPAGYIHSKAPAIVDAFVRGASIRPVNGAKWLWIPTKAVPRSRRGGSYSSTLSRPQGRRAGSAMGPEEVELHFNSELQVTIKGGKGFAFIDVVSGLRGGYRQASAGRLKGRRGMAPRKAKPVLMFTLVKGVKMPRLFDLQGPADKAAARVAQRIRARWG